MNFSLALAILICLPGFMSALSMMISYSLMAFFKKSKSPIETPPVVTKISQLCKALSRVEKVAFSSSFKRGKTLVSQFKFLAKLAMAI